MADTVQLVPTGAIDEDATLRGKANLEPLALAELETSIAIGGVRMRAVELTLDEARVRRKHGAIHFP